MMIRISLLAEGFHIGHPFNIGLKTELLYFSNIVFALPKSRFVKVSNPSTAFVSRGVSIVPRKEKQFGII